MPQHVVQQGECLSKIAHEHGFTWKTLWNHPENADFKKKRKDPNVLYPGDVLFIPEKEVKEVDAGTEKRHRFEKKETRVMLRIRLLDDGKPRKRVSYTLSVGSERFEGKTDGDGKLEHPVPVREAQATLVLEEDAYTLDIGALDPIDEVTGIQQRLQNLGFYGGDIDGRLGDRTKKGVRAFQEKHKLTATGDIDDATRSKVEQIHGS